MSNNNQQGQTMNVQSKKTTNTKDIEGSEQYGDEDISKRAKILLSTGTLWLSDLGELFNAEASLMVASFSRFFLLSILFAQALGLFVVFAFGFQGLALHEQLDLGALELFAAGLVATGVMVMVLRRLMHNVRKHLLPIASLDQIQTGLSDVIASLNSNPENAAYDPEHNNGKK